MEQKIIEFINNHQFDIRSSHNGRFTDQKCTPDVVCAVCECVLKYTENDLYTEFSKNDIWHFEYSNSLISESFAKPGLSESSMESEYDKFFAQPLKLLASADVLYEEKMGNVNFYRIKERWVLEYIAKNERTALFFLDAYLSKVMSDSGLIGYYEEFFKRPSNESLNELRIAMNYFYHRYTNIAGDYEPPRIYNKIINILAFKRKTNGSIRGNLSSGILTIDEIRYNRINWRDLQKDKNVSRQDFVDQFYHQLGDQKGYYKRNVLQSKNLVKSIETFSEIHRFKEYPGTHAHHIFMESTYPELADYPENIICVSPNQHYLKCHPNNKTQIVDRDYQIVCLLSKLDSIEINNKAGHKDYSLGNFTHVLNIGLDTTDFSPDMNFEDAKYEIMKHAYYKK